MINYNNSNNKTDPANEILTFLPINFKMDQRQIIKWILAALFVISPNKQKL